VNQCYCCNRGLPIQDGLHVDEKERYAIACTAHEYNQPIVKLTDEYVIKKRRNGRYSVTDVDGNPINDIEKVRILEAEGLINKWKGSNE